MTDPILRPCRTVPQPCRRHSANPCTTVPLWVCLFRGHPAARSRMGPTEEQNGAVSPARSATPTNERRLATNGGHVPTLHPSPRLTGYCKPAPVEKLRADTEGHSRGKTMAGKRCLTCGTITHATRCPTCTSRRKAYYNHPGYQATRALYIEQMKRGVAVQCVWCGTPLTPSTLRVDHEPSIAEAIRQGLDPTTSRLLPACEPCNSSRTP